MSTVSMLSESHHFVIIVVLVVLADILYGTLSVAVLFQGSQGWTELFKSFFLVIFCY